MSNPNPPSRTGSNRLSRFLLAAAVSGTFTLAACNRSPSGEASLNAETAADHAARLTASAGDLRVKPEFANSLEGKDSAQIKQIADAAIRAIAADHQNEHGVWKNYFEQKSVAADLDAAADLLNKALNGHDLSEPAIKSSVQAQLGATQLAEARLHLAAAQSKLLQLTEQAADYELAAAYINELGADAAVQEARARGDKPADLTSLQNDVQQAKENVSKAQQNVDDLQKQITDKQEQASKIYADTDAAFGAAENMQGIAAIDAARKAVDQRKQADQLSEEAAELGPKLTDAQQELNAAQIRQREAQSKLDAAQASNKQGEVRVQTANAQASILHDQARKLIEGATGAGDVGLANKYKNFMQLADSIKDDLDKAKTAAENAAKNYANAATSAQAFASSVSALGLPSGDPLAKAAADRTAQALLTLGQAAAKGESARASLIAYTVENMKSTVANAMQLAYKAADMQGEAPAVVAAKDAAANRDDALREFDAAASAAKSVAESSAIPSGTAAKWLAYTLQAVALHGEYLINGQNKEAYETAARNAKQANPFLELTALAPASETPSSAPATPH